MIFIYIMLIVGHILLFCGLAVVVFDIFEKLYDNVYLEIKSWFAFPKHKDKFLIKKGNKYIWVYK